MPIENIIIIVIKYLVDNKCNLIKYTLSKLTIK